MNYLDIVLIIFLTIGAIYGAISGGVRQLFSLLSIWLALILSLWTYRLVSRNILMGLFDNVSPEVADSFAFIILLIIFSVAIQLIFVVTSTSPEERRKGKKEKDINEMLDNVDKGFSGTIPNAIFGFFMGALNMAIILSVILGLMYFVYPYLGWGLQTSLVTSQLVPYFNQLLQYVFLSVKFFTPAHSPEIFRAIQQ